MVKLWTKAELDFLIKECDEGTSHISIASALGRSLHAVRKQVSCLVAKDILKKRDSFHKSVDRVLQFVPKEEPDFDGFLKLYGNFICVSDVHVPFWKRLLFEHIFLIAKKFGIKHIIIN